MSVSKDALDRLRRCVARARIALRAGEQLFAQVSRVGMVTRYARAFGG